MKRYISIIFAAMAVTACLEPIHRNDNLYDSAVFMVNSGITSTPMMYDCQETVDIPVYAYCGGFYGGAPEVSVSVDASAVQNYNAENFTSYKVLPSNCYRLDADRKQMEDKKATFILTFDVEALMNISTKDDYSDLDSMMVPLRIHSLTSGITDARDDRNNVSLIVPKLNQMSFKLDEEGDYELDRESAEGSGDGCIVLKYNIETLIENEWESDFDFDFNVNISDTVTTYDLLPADSYTISSSAERFTPGVSKITYTVKIDTTKLSECNYNIEAKLSSNGGFNLEGTGLSNIVFSNKPENFYPLDKWSVVDFNSAQSTTPGQNNYPGNMLDTTATMWHNSWGQGKNPNLVPAFVTIKLETPFKITSYRILRRQDNNVTDLKCGHIEVAPADTSVGFTRISDYYFGTKTEYPGKEPLLTRIPKQYQTTCKYIKVYGDESNRNNAISIQSFLIYGKADEE